MSLDRGSKSLAIVTSFAPETFTQNEDGSGWTSTHGISPQSMLGALGVSDPAFLSYVVVWGRVCGVHLTEQARVYF